jgi:hypothetical protein
MLFENLLLLEDPLVGEREATDTKLSFLIESLKFDELGQEAKLVFLS